MAAKPPMLEVAGGPEGSATVRISSPDRLMWPDAGITKLDLAQYAVAVGRRLHARAAATGR